MPAAMDLLERLRREAVATAADVTQAAVDAAVDAGNAAGPGTEANAGSGTTAAPTGFNKLKNKIMDEINSCKRIYNVISINYSECATSLLPW